MTDYLNVTLKPAKTATVSSRPYYKELLVLLAMRKA